MVKYYYDTGVFGYFLFREDWEHQYSPTKVSAYMSVFCDEELIYAHMNGKFKEWGVNVSFVEISEKILNIGSIFQPHDTNLSDIRAKFIHMMGSLAQNNVDIRADFVEYQQKQNRGAPKPLDGMDWLHLAVADILGCEVILTRDNGFNYLSKIGRYLRLEKVRKAFVFSSKDKMEKIDEVRIG
jgi:predicted nucleic acid-binding protein